MPVASVDDAFRELLSRIELSPFRVALASRRFNALKTSIEGAFAGKTVASNRLIQTRDKNKTCRLQQPIRHGSFG